MARQSRGGERASGTEQAGTRPQGELPEHFEKEARSLARKHALPVARVRLVLLAIRDYFIDLEGAPEPEVAWVLMDAVGALGAERDLALLEADGLRTLLDRLMAALRLSLLHVGPRGMALMSVGELAARTEAVLRALQDGRDRLVRDGFGTNYSGPGFPARLLLNVYPIRPYWLTTWSDDASLDGDSLDMDDGIMAGTPGEVGAPGSTSSRSLDAPEQAGGASDLVPGERLFPEVDVVRLKWLSPADAARV